MKPTVGNSSHGLLIVSAMIGAALVGGLGAFRSVLTSSRVHLDKELRRLDIAPGKEAVAIGIDEGMAAGSLLAPGCRVGVIHTADGVARILVPDALVLAVDRPGGKLGQIRDGTAFLQVDPAEAAKIRAAREKGSLSLVIRSPGGNPKATG
ncbi:hypothetical protein AYO40_01830 [Planctomycetaceae bacterium SCGC AG-212-D15]|nr:hypothetical protein AYO40_01830 [Planctomycetaceae bacterium SCGC AG-212-D15]